MTTLEQDLDLVGRTYTAVLIIIPLLYGYIQIGKEVSQLDNLVFF